MMQGVRFFCLVVGLLISTFSGELSAYTIESGFTRSCHEQISLPAVEFYLSALGEREALPLPNDDVWRRATGDVARELGVDPELRELLRDEGLEFAAVSLLVGLREPDTDGYSVSDLSAVRSAHGVKTPRAQYAHALRASVDEGPSADMQALAGARAVIREHLDDYRNLEQGPAASEITTTHLYVDHYGRVEVEVWGPAHRLGLALHALQDSFSHSIRTEDGAHVLHVLNYIDAVHGDLQEEVDGLAHSTALDQCTRSENQPAVLAASDRSVALVAAALKMTEGDEGQALSEGLTDCAPGHLGDMECGWLSYFPECQAAVLEGRDLTETCCSRATDFCEASLLPTILETPSRPYLQTAAGCTFGATRTPGRGRAGILAALFFTLSCLVLLRSRPRRRGVAVRALPFLTALLGVSWPKRAVAQEHFPSTFALGVEAHGSLLTDALRESIFNISYGPAFRGGYRFPGGKSAQFGVFGFFERDAWVVSEYEVRADPGVLNFGLGIELLYFEFLRSSLLFGPSVLVFDTALHDEGTTGIFTELKPLGAQLYFWDRWGLTFDPLSVAWVNPTPENGRAPSVGHMQYRTSVGLEWRSVPRR
jgi:hypothetical protein